MWRLLGLVSLIAQHGFLVQPDHMRVGLHLIESRMYWNMESIVEGIVIRIVDLCRLHSQLLLANVAEGLSGLQPQRATTVPNRDQIELPLSFGPVNGKQREAGRIYGGQYTNSGSSSHWY